MRKLLYGVFVLTLALGFASSGWGQSQITAGTVQGDVLDEKGGSVAGASVKTKTPYNSFLIFSPPDITTPIRTSPGIPQKVGAARKNNCCEEVYAETVQKHKSVACGNLQCFESSFGCNPSVCRNAPPMLKDGGRDVSYNRGPWKQSSIQFASSK